MSNMPLYLTGSGSIKREHNTLVVRKGDDRPIYRPVSGVLAIYNYGRYKWNTTLLAFLDDMYIPMHVFSSNGMYRGTFYNPPIPSSEVFVKQIEFFTDKGRVKQFAKLLSKAHESNKKLVSYTPTTPYEKTIQTIFKGLLYASLIDGIYMTHLDPTVYPAFSGVGMPLVYAVFGVFVPSAVALARRYIDDNNIKPSDFYPCKYGACPRSSLLASIFTYWEKIATQSVNVPSGTVPRRHLFRLEFYKIEKLIMWDIPYEPFSGLWQDYS